MPFTTCPARGCLLIALRGRAAACRAFNYRNNTPATGLQIMRTPSHTAELRARHPALEGRAQNAEFVVSIEKDMGKAPGCRMLG